MPIGLYMKKKVDSNVQNFKTGLSRSPTSISIRWSCLFFARNQTSFKKWWEIWQIWKPKLKKGFKVDENCAHCKIVFKCMGCCYQSCHCHCQETVPSLSDGDNEGRNKISKRLMIWDRNEFAKKNTIAENRRKCEWWKNLQTNEKNYESSPNHSPLKNFSANSFLVKKEMAHFMLMFNWNKKLDETISVHMCKFMQLKVIFLPSPRKCCCIAQKRKRFYHYYSLQFLCRTLIAVLELTKREMTTFEGFCSSKTLNMSL